MCSHDLSGFLHDITNHDPDAHSSPPLKRLCLQPTYPASSLGSPPNAPGSPLLSGVGSPRRVVPLNLRETPRVSARRGAHSPPRPTVAPSHAARPRPKFTPKTRNLQTRVHNVWTDIKVVNGPYDFMEKPYYDVALTSGDEDFPKNLAVPESTIRRNPTTSASESPLQRFPLGCIVWVRVKTAFDWAPGWVVEMPKHDVPSHLRGNPDSYYVELFHRGICIFVEDTAEDPDILPFDSHPPSAETRTLFTAEVDQKIDALLAALGIYFEGISLESQEEVLQWRGALRMVHRMAIRMVHLREQLARHELAAQGGSDDTPFSPQAPPVHLQVPTSADLERQIEVAANWEKQFTDIKHQLEAKERDVVQLRTTLEASEAARQRLHATVMELRGNVRVVCRVRPPTPAELTRSHVEMRFPEPAVLQLGCTDGRLHTFSFDRAFSPAATNADVFEEVAPLVQSVLQGYNVCLFTYGQTGSGKTWTMQGPPTPAKLVSELDTGLIARSMSQIFSHIEQQRAEGWRYDVCIKIVEIYNEKLHDLLLPTTHPVHGQQTPRQPLPQGKSPRPAPKLGACSRFPSKPLPPKGGCPPMSASSGRPPCNRGKMAPQAATPTPSPKHPFAEKTSTGRCHAETERSSSPPLDCVSVHPIQCPADLEPLLRRARERRATTSTECNDVSSRSHFLCLVSVQGTHADQGLFTQGVLNMVDLAGSERLGKSGSSGVNLKETQHINKSLFCLTTVITALASHARYIPFRNSKLTWLLKDSLSCNSKVMTLVTLSPTAESEQETLCSLRFASKAHDCDLGSPKREVMSNVQQ